MDAYVYRNTSRAALRNVTVHLIVFAPSIPGMLHRLKAHEQTNLRDFYYYVYIYA